MTDLITVNQILTAIGSVIGGAVLLAVLFKVIGYFFRSDKLAVTENFAIHSKKLEKLKDDRQETDLRVKEISGIVAGNTEDIENLTSLVLKIADKFHEMDLSAEKRAGFHAAAISSLSARTSENLQTQTKETSARITELGKDLCAEIRELRKDFKAGKLNG